MKWYFILVFKRRVLKWRKENTNLPLYTDIETFGKWVPHHNFIVPGKLGGWSSPTAPIFAHSTLVRPMEGADPTPPSLPPVLGSAGWELQQPSSAGMHCTSYSIACTKSCHPCHLVSSELFNEVWVSTLFDPRLFADEAIVTETPQPADSVTK